MVLQFRISELKTFLNYTQISSIGRKTELQQRAIDLVENKNPNPDFIKKAREIYKEKYFNLFIILTLIY